MYTPSVQLLDPKLGYVGNDKSKSLIVLDALRDISALMIHNSKLSRERQMDKFPTYPITVFNVEDRVLARNNTRNVWDPKYDVAFHMV